MVDPKPLLKGFGAAADVVGQIATDKAVNSRRVRSDFFRFDFTDGQLIEDHQFSSAQTTTVPHSLGRVPKGALGLRVSTGQIVCQEATANTVTIWHSVASPVVTLWIV